MRIESTATVYDSARVYGSARVGGEGDISAQHHVAWVDRVGSGRSMTLHRIRRDGGFGWRINSGCCHFEADTIDAVCAAVRANVAAGPDEWADEDEATRARWAPQVDAALTFLASMCWDDTITAPLLEWNEDAITTAFGGGSIKETSDG